MHIFHLMYASSFPVSWLELMDASCPISWLSSALTSLRMFIQTLNYQCYLKMDLSAMHMAGRCCDFIQQFLCSVMDPGAKWSLPVFPRKPTKIPERTDLISSNQQCFVSFEGPTAKDITFIYLKKRVDCIRVWWWQEKQLYPADCRQVVCSPLMATPSPTAPCTSQCLWSTCSKAAQWRHSQALPFPTSLPSVHISNKFLLIRYIPAGEFDT